ncbi:SDR family oxidoreductase [Mesorhizobium sp. MSK_1335]|uniref:SDR family oxidoreductase n=1 Tax=Mesorhizobium montanum TaxID=3072323 RepID=A0ABU4ZKK0_9HYPH|nr:SDR family oxidoreductase [Mesorhizobium sp. MSK_1335]MDX8525906.1 SDR family oxidoreductase [Mesorhizobium sp. MSK_1335]
MRVLLVGASSDLGKAIHTVAEASGHQVAATYWSRPIPGSGIQLDVRSEESAATAVAAAYDALGGVDAMIYCSAIDHPQLVGQADIQRWKEVFDVNYFGALRLTRLLLPHFLRSGSGIFQYISSGLATRSNIGTSAYASSKAALNALAMGVSKEYAKSGVRAYTIMPGFIDGGLIRNLDQSKRARIATLIDSKRIATSDEIGSFCVSVLQNSSYVTGCHLEIHGGLA